MPVSELTGKPTEERTTEEPTKGRWKANRNRKASLLQSRVANDRLATVRTQTTKKTSKAKKCSNGRPLHSDVAPQLPRRLSFDKDPLTPDTCEGLSSSDYSLSESATHAVSQNGQQHRSISRVMGSLPSKLVKHPARLAKSARRRLRIRAEKRRQSLLDEPPKSGGVEDEHDNESFGDDSMEESFLKSRMALIDVHFNVHCDEATEMTLSTPHTRRRSIGISDVLEVSLTISDSDNDPAVDETPHGSGVCDAIASPTFVVPSLAKELPSATPVSENIASEIYLTISSMSCHLADAWADHDIFGGACAGMTSLADVIATPPPVQAE
jgi:hypothetical protein